MPLPLDPIKCDCCCPKCSVAPEGPDLYKKTSQPVRYASGEVVLAAEDLHTAGFGVPWGHTRSFASQLSLDANLGNGYNWLVKEWSFLTFPSADTAVVVGGANDGLWFDLHAGAYMPRYSIRQQLQLDAANHIYVLFDLDGSRTHYKAGNGAFLRYLDPFGHETAVVAYAPNQFSIQEIQRSVTIDGTTTVESFLYTYNDPTQYPPLLESVMLRRQVDGGGWTNVRRAVYSYYGDGEPFGGQDDLKTAERQVWDNGAWVSLGTSYYRYYLGLPASTSSDSSSSSSSSAAPSGPAHLLKYVVNPAAFARLAAITDPLTAQDDVLAPYADHYFEYDEARRVTKEVIEGGTRAYRLDYKLRNNPLGYNSWRTKTIETMPDGNQNIVYSNFAGQTMLRVLKSGDSQWCEFFEYDGDAKVVVAAKPSAVAGFDEQYPDLLHYVGGKYQYLRDTDGLLRRYTYHRETGHLLSEAVQHGELSSPILVHTYSYVACTQASSSSSSSIPISSLSSSSASLSPPLLPPPVYFLASEVEYPLAPEDVSSSSSSSPSDLLPQMATTYDYTWYGGTCQVQLRVTTLPVIPTEQNGNGITAIRQEYFDSYRNLTYRMDERGFITSNSYDIPTGAVKKRIDDVDTARVNDAPPAWVTPTGGGLHLITDYKHDEEGRSIQILGPTHTIDIEGVATTIRGATWSLYLDGSFKTLTGQGYVTGTAPDYSYTLVNPVSIRITDADGKPIEFIRAVRASSGGPLSGDNSFPQSSYVRWTTTQYADGWHVSSQRNYKLIPTSGAGVSGTNYDQSNYDYDVMFNQNRIETPGGTIMRTVFDPRGNPGRVFIGTIDTGSTDSDPAGTGNPSNNMVMVTQNEYDNGQAGGDNNLTRQTQHVDALSARTTHFHYDWRERLTDVDGEIDLYAKLAYDNLDRVVMNERFDTSSAGNLVTREMTFHDNRNQVYKKVRFGIDPGTGHVGNALVDNAWFDLSGNVLKRLPSGSQLFKKYTYDSLARLTTQYIGYNLDETGFPSGSVANDIILEQIETTYDADSNLIQIAKRRRYHNAIGTGILGSPNSNQPRARVTYAAYYPDPLGRNQATVDYGTNGGTPLVRAAAIPQRSDTVLIESTHYDRSGNVELIISPAGKATCFYYDALGREIQKTTNCQMSSSSVSSCESPSTDDCPAADDANIAVQTFYNDDGNVTEITAANSSSGDQVTRYIYGSTLPESSIASTLLVRCVVLPEATGSCVSSSSSSSSGGSVAHNQIVYTYNRQGDVVIMSDQNGTVHAYDYDLLGRQISDRIVVLGSGIDGIIRRISTSYEVHGNLSAITSYDNAVVGQGSVVNDVVRQYDSFAQLMAEYQSHFGAVNLVSTPQCKYRYDDGSSNTIRPLSLVYPNGRVLSYDYGTVGSMDNILSRPTSLIDTDGVTRLCGYTYLGLSGIVKSESLQPTLIYTLIGMTDGNDPVTGDIYRGLDTFSRVKDLVWTLDPRFSSSSSSSSCPANVVERIQHGYDRASMRQWRANLADLSCRHDELYSYDKLSRLSRMERGSLNAAYSAVLNRTFAQCWSHDATGNWASFRQDNDGNGIWDLVQKRTANRLNEITSITSPASMTGGLPLALSAPLGTASAQRLSWVQPVYDAAGNTTSLPRPDDPTKGFTATFDAWNRLTQLLADGVLVASYQYDGLRRRVVNKSYVGGALSETKEWYYSAGWRELEERVGTNVREQFVWGLRHIDDLVLRDRDTVGDGGLNERLYAIQDANWNVTALVDSRGNVTERFLYAPYGQVVSLDPNWMTRPDSNYGWRFLFQGGRLDISSGLYDFRHRDYSPLLGRWLQQDPMGFSTGNHNLYMGFSGSPVNYVDPFGLQERFPTRFPAENEKDFIEVLKMILGRQPTDRELTIANQGCVGLSQLALGTAKRPNLEPGTRCFRFDKFPSQAQLNKLLADVGSQMKCPACSEPRLFAVQFWAYWNQAALEGPLSHLNIKPPKQIEGGLWEVDPRSIDPTAAPPNKINFDFVVYYNLGGEPVREFWLHMNKGRVTDPTGCVVKLSCLEDVQKQSFTHTLFCIRPGRETEWYDQNWLQRKR